MVRLYCYHDRVRFIARSVYIQRHSPMVNGSKRRGRWEKIGLLCPICGYSPTHNAISYQQKANKLLTSYQQK